MILTHLSIFASIKALERSSMPRQWSASLEVAASSLTGDLTEDVEDGTSSVSGGGMSRVGGDWRGVSTVSWEVYIRTFSHISRGWEFKFFSDLLVDLCQ